MIILVAEHQSLFDIAIQYSGSALAAFDIAVANGISVTDDLTPGQKLKIPVSIYKNDEVANYFGSRSQGIATYFNEIVPENNIEGFEFPGGFPMRF